MQNKDWISYVIDWFETGSRVVCDPPVMDTDYDVVALVDSLQKINELRDELGFDYGGSLAHDAEYHSLRRGDLNLILTLDNRDFDMFKLATRVSKVLNVTDKKKRVLLFEAIRHGDFRYDAE